MKHPSQSSIALSGVSTKPGQDQCGQKKTFEYSSKQSPDSIAGRIDAQPRRVAAVLQIVSC
jgi:hypothetical protein